LAEQEIVQLIEGVHGVNKVVPDFIYLPEREFD